MAPSKSGILMHGQQDQLKLGLLGFFGWDFLYRMPYPSLRWLCSQRKCQSAGELVSFNGLCPRVPSGILAFIRPRTRSAYWTCDNHLWSCRWPDLWTIPYWVQDMQVAVVCLNGADRTFKDRLLYSSHYHCSDLVMYAWTVGHTSRPRCPQ